MIVRKETFLQARDFSIHEAGHLFLGRLFGFPMTSAEVFADGSGGLTHFDREQVANEAAASAEVEIPESIQRQAAMNLAAVFLGGHAAEAVHSATNLDYIIGSRTSDYARAHEVVERFMANPGDIETAWHYCCRVLIQHWPDVLALSKEIPMTDGSHNPPVL